MDVVSYSCLNYAVWLIPIYFIESKNTFQQSPVEYYLFYLCVLFLSPIVLTAFFVWMRSWSWLQRVLPHPTGRAWDFYFGLRKPCWIIVTLKDGKKLGGKFSSSSFASSSPEPQQIYLEENWAINEDGGLERPRNETGGLLILSQEIESIEFFKFSNNKE